MTPPMLEAAPTRELRLKARLDAAGRVRLQLDALLVLWDLAAPELASRADRFELLAVALENLEAAGHIQLPAAASWDRTTTPALPGFVTVPGARKVRRPESWRRYPWHPELAWVASLPTLPERQQEDLLAIDRWLADRGATGSDPVPVRLRSSEVLGDEKRLDDLSVSALFGPGRLTLELLSAQRYPPPIALRRVGDGPEVLIVENSDPFWACVSILGSIGGRIGTVAFGAGGSAEASISALAWEETPPGAIWYWGDLDPRGIEIATRTATRAGAAGLVPVRPAAPLWTAQTTCRIAEPGRHTWLATHADWLGPTVWEATAAVREAGGCVRQEALTFQALEIALGLLDTSSSGPRR